MTLIKRILIKYHLNNHIQSVSNTFHHFQSIFSYFFNSIFFNLLSPLWMSIIILFLMMDTNLFIATKCDALGQNQYFLVLSRGYRCTLMQTKIIQIALDVLEKEYKVGRIWRSRSYDHNPKNWLVKVYHFDNIDISDVVNPILLEKLNLIEVYLDCFFSQL